MAFHEIRLPDRYSRGATGGVMFLTNLLTQSAGHEKRNQQWSVPRE